MAFFRRLLSFSTSYLTLSFIVTAPSLHSLLLSVIARRRIRSSYSPSIKTATPPPPFFFFPRSHHFLLSSLRFSKTNNINNDSLWSYLIFLSPHDRARTCLTLLHHLPPFTNHHQKEPPLPLHIPLSFRHQ